MASAMLAPVTSVNLTMADNDTDLAEYDATFAAAAAADADDINIIKARTMYNMVEHFTIQGESKNLLFLTNAQAKVFDEENVGKIIEAFNIPKPHLVINLMRSKMGIATDSWFRFVGVSHFRTAIYNREDANRGMTELTLFMKNFVIPLAASSNAVILVQLLPECGLLAAFSAALKQIRNRFGSQLPFTVLGIDAAYHFYKHTALNLGDLYPFRDDCSSPRSQFTKAVSRKSIRWMEYLKKLQQYPYSLPFAGGTGAAYLPYGIENLIVVDGYSENISAVRDEEPMLGLKNLILSHFASRLPSFTLQTDMMVHSCIDMLESGIPVIFLDSRLRHKYLKPLPQLAFHDGQDASIANKARGAPSVLDKASNLSALGLVAGGVYRPRVLEGVVKFKCYMTNVFLMNADNCTQAVDDILSAHTIAYFHAILFDEGGDDMDSQLGTPKISKQSSSEEQPTWLCLALSGAQADSAMAASRLCSREELQLVVDTIVIARFTGIEITDKIESIKSISDVSGRLCLLEDIIKWDWSFLHNHPERDKQSQEFSLEVHAILAHPKSYHGNVVINQDRLKSKIREICNLDRLPRKNAHTEMVLLRDAWDIVDICMHVAFQYKVVAKFLYVLLLLLAIAITSISILRDIIDSTCAIPGNCVTFLSGSSSMTFSDALVFILAVASSIVASLLAFLNPVARWRSLRASAMQCESIIWQFRARTGIFDLQGTTGTASAAMGHIRVDPHQTPAHRLRLAISSVRSGLQEGGDLQSTSFNRMYSASVYKHGQYHPFPVTKSLTSIFQYIPWCSATKLKRHKRMRVIPLYSSDMDENQTESYFSSLSVKSDGGGKVGLGDVESTSGEFDLLDDFQSPVKPEDYIELRLGQKLLFYQGRVPYYNGFYSSIRGSLIIGAGVGAIMSFFGYARYVAIVSACSTSLTAYLEFNSTDQKLARYNQVISSLQNHLEWWKSLTLIETVDRSNISLLVSEAERIFSGEIGNWVSRPASAKAFSSGPGELVSASSGAKHVDASHLTASMESQPRATNARGREQ